MDAYDPSALAERMKHMPIAEARAELSEILDRAWGLGFGQDFAQALDFNAKLVTALRNRGVKIWGVEPEGLPA
jgi:hypothetical protein